MRVQDNTGVTDTVCGDTKHDFLLRMGINGTVTFNQILNISSFSATTAVTML